LHHHDGELRPGAPEGIHAVRHGHGSGGRAAHRDLPDHRPGGRPERQRAQV
ncbi:unnamed protein product, partial [Tetraodon nigroviridis]